MVKPRKEGATGRRIVSISLYGLVAIALILLAPLWIPIGFVVGAIRRRSFIVLRLLTFGMFYFTFEMVTLVRVAIARSRFAGDTPSFQARILTLQGWWAGTIVSVASHLLRLTFSVEGTEHATPGPAILLIRHASILDTLLPTVFIQRPTNWRVRYVVKQELLVDPCIDIAGHILPNYFIDRSGDRRAELAGIRTLARDLGDDGVLIFPEGTRFSEDKRARALARIGRDAPEVLALAESLEGVLPPKPGGVTALLDALPGVDCVFLAHRGLEQFNKVSDVLSGAVVGSTVHVRIWRVDSESIPRQAGEQVCWLYEQWNRVSAFVTDRETSA